MKKHKLHRRYSRAAGRESKLAGFERMLGRKLKATEAKLWRAVHRASTVVGWKKAKAAFDHALSGGKS